MSQIELKMKSREILQLVEFIDSKFLSVYPKTSCEPNKKYEKVKGKCQHNGNLKILKLLGDVQN